MQHEIMQQLLTPPATTVYAPIPLPYDDMALPQIAGPPPDELLPFDDEDDATFSNNMPFNSLGLILDPLLLYQYNWAEEAPPVPSAPRIGTIDLPEVDISQGYDGLEANNNSLPAEQQVHEVEGQAVPAGQPLPPTQGGINLDEGFALQEEPFIAPEAYAENIETGYFLVNEPAAYDDEGGLEEGLLIAHPVLEPVDFDPFMSVGDDDEAMEI